MLDESDGKMAAALLQMSCLYRGTLAVRATGIRTLIPGIVPAQFRAFSVRREPEVGENPFYEKYRDKIQKLRSSKPKKYEARLENRHEARREALGQSKQEEQEGEQEVKQQLENTDRMAASAASTQNKTLGSIFNMETIRDKTGEEIAALWMKFYSTKDTVSAVIPAQIYELIFSRSQTCQMFLYALPQEDGYEFFVGQWSGHELHFTSLANVQTLGENAPSQLILCHYPDLKEEKGLVLMTAELDPKFITVHHAQCLANQVKLFYGTRREETYRLVETFNHRPADFRHTSVLAELERSGLGPAAEPTGS
ncbi:ATP synthase mitochondrial F1 complex assembly factor 1 isoform X4 [Brachionichthys hirsutus]|uniref:ATP synthase mitochondrial F1 complex assembly factor 1 isoform X4 n=1 Tax=Brachionichthys hirsutus TaxID=412623 RepID=UPI003605441E